VRDYIYFVTVFYIPYAYLDGKYLNGLKEKPKDWDNFLYKRIRCGGWFDKEVDAEDCIRENHADIYENGYYNFAIIERSSQGPLGISSSIKEGTRYFKVFYTGENSYHTEEIEEPKLFNGIYGFAY
tara:strand:+ start:6993 stop:7370 length:378 start_codon:yes stop_codon:yes gene_type:complete